MSLSCSSCSRQILALFLQETVGVSIQRSNAFRNFNTRNFSSSPSSTFRLSLQRQDDLATAPYSSCSDDFYVPFASLTLPSTSSAPAISALPPAFRPPPPPSPQDTEYERDSEPEIQLLGDIAVVHNHATQERSFADSHSLDDQPLHDNMRVGEPEEIYESTLVQQIASSETFLDPVVDGSIPVTTIARLGKEHNTWQTHSARLESWKQRWSREEAPEIVTKLLPRNQAPWSVEQDQHSLKSSTKSPMSPFKQITKGTATDSERQRKQSRDDLRKHGAWVSGNKLVSTSRINPDTKPEPRRIQKQTSDNPPDYGDSVPGNKLVSVSRTSADTKLEPWQIQKHSLKDKFGDTGGWNPRKKLSPDALEGIRALNAQYPDRFTTPILADQFKVSPEAIRRILKSKWRPNAEEDEERRARWDKRGERIWSNLVELGVHPPKKWRQMGIGGGPRRPAQDRSLRREREEWDEDRRLKEEMKRDGNAWVTSLAKRII